MTLFYALALLPAAAGAVMWVRNKEVAWQEWLMGTAAAFVLAAVFHLVLATSMTGDVETWSGKVVRAVHHPYWYAEWWETETYTEYVGTGKNRRSVTKTRRVKKSKHHPQYWECVVNYGKSEDFYRIDESDYANYRKEMGANNIRVERGYRPHFERGDRNDYWIDNVNGVIIPAHKVVSFENRVKACPSVFSFASVPETVGVYEYPASDSWRVSDRLVGEAARHFSIRKWDEMNAILGPEKKVNVIAVGFYQMQSMLGQYQEAKWFGGKKNDIVVCYGPAGNDGRPTWVYCFGWTEKTTVKRQLEELFLNEKPGDAIIPKIKDKIRQYYEIKDWSKFNYLSIEPPTWSYLVFLLVMAATQVGFWVWAHRNDINERCPR